MLWLAIAAMAPRVVLLVGLLGVAVALVVTLAPQEPRRSGTNDVPLADSVLRVAPGSEKCQDEDVPDATRVVRLRAEPGAVQRVAVRVVAADGSVVRGRATRVAEDGVVDVGLPRSPAAGPGAVCVRNAGSLELTLAGFPTGQVAGRPTGPIRIDYYRGGVESWWPLGGVVADRMAFGMSGLVGGFALWLAVLLAIVAWGLACAALWRIGVDR